MKIGIMQPYFFPYIGYFQLIEAVDIFVNLEHVNFIKSSYMVRNTIKNNIPINIPVRHGSSNKTCTDINVIANNHWFIKFEKKITQLYKKEKNFDLVFTHIIEPWKKNIIESDNCTISEFNISSIKEICKYLDMEKKFESSLNITNKKKNEALKDIIKYYNCNHYINAIGGQKLYSKVDFASEGIDLNFIKMRSLNIENPYYSILDSLFKYDKNKIKEELKKYELI